MPKIYYIVGCHEAAQYIVETEDSKIETDHLRAILDRESNSIEVEEFITHAEVNAFKLGLEALDFSGYDHIVVSENLAIPILLGSIHSNE